MTAALVLVTPGLVLVLLGVVTGMGSRRRRCGWVVTVLSAVFFPIAWVDWYVRDEERGPSLWVHRDPGA